MKYRAAATALAAPIAALALCGSARAEPATGAAKSPTRDAVLSTDRAAEESPNRPRIGVLGGIGFPRPLAVEGIVTVGDWVGLGVEYGVLPAITIDDVQTSLWSLAGDIRVFPFRGGFFIGLRAGHQRIDASTTIVSSLGSAAEELTLDSWFVNPRIGYLWTSRPGLALGVEAGIQIPFSSSVSSTLPLSYLPSAQSTADTLGNTVLPTVDLLRIGLLL